MLTFIVNPVAGVGAARDAEKRLRAELDRLGREAVFLHTGEAHEAEALAREAARPGETVVSVGGDGTASEVASGLLGTGAALGIIPAGTGNDFIKTTGIPADPVEALHFLLEKPARPIDVGLANGKAFLNVCGTGFDVMVLDHAERFKRRFHGLLPYLLGLLQAIWHYRPVQLHLNVDGHESDEQALICAVANGRWIGGGIPICPDARPDDGKLDLVLVGHVPRWKIPFYLPGLMSRKVLTFPFTRHLLCDRVTLRGDSLRVQTDGEISGMASVTFEMRPGSLLLHW